VVFEYGRLRDNRVGGVVIEGRGDGSKLTGMVRSGHRDESAMLCTTMAAVRLIWRRLSGGGGEALVLYLGVEGLVRLEADVSRKLLVRNVTFHHNLDKLR
jgi:hypothetical protein